MFNPSYRITSKIVGMLTAIVESRAVIERARLLPKNEIKLRRQALIRMSHSSTGIEGNILNYKQVESIVAHKKIDAPERVIRAGINCLVLIIGIKIHSAVCLGKCSVVRPVCS